jgi:hypothetical protein
MWWQHKYNMTQEYRLLSPYDLKGENMSETQEIKKVKLVGTLTRQLPGYTPKTIFMVEVKDVPDTGEEIDKISKQLLKVLEQAKDEKHQRLLNFLPELKVNVHGEEILYALTLLSHHDVLSFDVKQLMEM